MPLGRPVSQPCGLFQGVSDAFSGSPVLAQPPPVTTAKASNSSINQREPELEITSLTKPGGRE